MALKVLIVRHAIAEDREAFKQTGLPDTKRPLTLIGRKDFKKVSRHIETLWSDIDLIAYSPLTRARQTARILKKRYPHAHEVQIDELRPGQRPEKLLEWLRKVGRASTVVVVGHEPDLGELLSYCVAARKTPILDFKKGGFVLIEFEDRIDKGLAKIICCIQPSHLRRLKPTRVKN